MPSAQKVSVADTGMSRHENVTIFFSPQVVKPEKFTFQIILDTYLCHRDIYHRKK